MKPVFEDGKLSVELHKPEIATLLKARDIAAALDALHQASGAPLVAAIDAALGSDAPRDKVPGE